MVSKATVAREQDGRKARSVRTRALIVDAVMKLIDDGNLQPTSEEVAQLADVGHRTVFRHFEDMDTLYREIDERLFERVIRHAVETSVETPMPKRVRQIIDMRAGVYEDAKMFRRSTMIRRWQSPYLQKAHKRYVKFLRERMHTILPELATCPGYAVGAMETLLSFEAWEQLRQDQRLPVVRAKEVQEKALLAMLGID